MGLPHGLASQSSQETSTYSTSKSRTHSSAQDERDFDLVAVVHRVEGYITEYEVTGLQPGETYHFQVSARDSVGIEHGGGGWILGPEAEVTL